MDNASKQLKDQLNISVAPSDAHPLRTDPDDQTGASQSHDDTGDSSGGNSYGGDESSQHNNDEDSHVFNSGEELE